MTTEQMNRTIDVLQDERDALNPTSPTFYDDFDAITSEIRDLEQESSANASADEFADVCGYHHDQD